MTSDDVKVLVSFKSKSSFLVYDVSLQWLTKRADKLPINLISRNSLEANT